eukprot:GHVT01030820.1.p3 GENE.GHVT01030820.1~~GHVT01030820.1.p3  ORF type:complete len:108 (-),score=18.15 GHVT01030820.1:827-1150(-)
MSFSTSVVQYGWSMSRLYCWAVKFEIWGRSAFSQLISLWLGRESEATIPSSSSASLAAAAEADDAERAASETDGEEEEAEVPGHAEIVVIEEHADYSNKNTGGHTKR